MGTNLAWFYDVIAVALVISYIYIGGKRGFVKTVLLLLGYVFALVFGHYVSMAVAEPVYDNLVASRVEAVISENYESINISSIIQKHLLSSTSGSTLSEEEISEAITKSGDMFDNIAQAAKESGADDTIEEIKARLVSLINTGEIMKSVDDAVPQSVSEILSQTVDHSVEDITIIVRALAGDDKELGVKTLHEKAVKPLLVGAIELLMWIIMFSVAMILVRIVVELVSRTFKAVPIVSSANSLLGGILGAVQGALIIIVIALVLKIVVSFTANELMFLNETVINESNIFKIAYNWKLFG